MSLLLSIPAIAALIAVPLLVFPSGAKAHEEKMQRPQTVAEAWIPMTDEEWKQVPKYRHPPGNVRAEDMVALFGNTVMVIDWGREMGFIPDHALKVVFIGRGGRYALCANGPGFKYFFSDHVWAPIKRRHKGRLWQSCGDRILLLWPDGMTAALRWHLLDAALKGDAG